MEGGSVAVAETLQTLLTQRPAAEAQLEAQEAILASLPRPIVPEQLTDTLSFLLAGESAKSAAISSRLAGSQAAVATLLTNTRKQLATIQVQTNQLNESHTRLEDALTQYKETLAVLSQSEPGNGTLKDRLEELLCKRQQLQVMKQYFAIFTRAEELGSVL